MSSKFRHDSTRRNYTVRTFLRRCLGLGMIFLLLLFCGSTLGAFYYLIWYEVKQSIEIGFMKNLTMRSETLAIIKMNEIEDIGRDLSTSASMLSDLVSFPDRFAD